MDYLFKVIIEECEEGGFYAECPSFQGCHIEAETYEEAMREIKSCIKSFIEDYKEKNQEIPMDNFSVSTVRVAV